MRLSSEQIAIIRTYIDKSTISIDSLKDDLVDHLCCVVEIKIERGGVFDMALREALYELAPDGLNEIQHETVFLLNSTKIILMKKVMYSIGLLSAMVFVLGWAFGIMHLPGATELSIYGFLTFVFIFLPMLALDHYKLNIRWALSDKLKFGLGFASGIIVALSVVFKLMHLSGAQELLIIGTALFVFGFLPFVFFNMYKKSVS